MDVPNVMDVVSEVYTNTDPIVSGDDVLNEWEVYAV